MSDKLKVLQCMLTNSGGSSILAMELGAGLASDHHVNVRYCHCNPETSEPVGRFLLKADGGNLTAKMLDMPEALAGALDAGTAFLKIQDQWPFDLIHLHSLQVFGSPAYMLKQMRGVPYVVTCHGSDVLSPHFMDANIETVAWLLGEAAAVTCVSEFVAQQLRQKIPQIDPVVIHNFPRRLWLNTHPTPRSGNHFLHVSSLRDVKRPEWLFEAFSLLKEKQPEARLTIVTTGEGLQRGAEWIRRYGASGIQLVDGAGEGALEQAYAETSALVLCSRFEGFGLVILEALLHGTPVIAPAVSAIPEILGHDWPLLTREEDGPAGIARMMSRLSQLRPDPATFHKILNRFNPDKQITAYADLFERVIEDQMEPAV